MFNYPATLRRLALLWLASLASTTMAANNIAEQQDHESLRNLATDYMQQLAKSQAGSATISIGAVDPRLNLAACDALSAFLPAGSKAWGKTTVGIRCAGPVAWTLYLRANVQITADYYVASRTLTRGQVLTADDLSKIRGEVSNFASGVVSNPEQAIGKAIQFSLSSGSVLRPDALKNPPVVQQGQSVRVVSNGAGFQVTTDGQALSNAAEGEMARARTSSGLTLSGIAKAGGIIEISN
ncbi:MULTISPECIES: flagellar basal body P-ring formation chaperone FlgA [unclassified Undibacterium]|uniref:flagellar basal body P-ring formation chaperone FlgA n=2 Tax=Pseudomonadati TaxID=3379134 RepID=UPI002AC90020|nr:MULTISPECIES: flagellar basal body P-ring formation chaperone FlgA [unclassified Undibacterium]MEB0138789.1 flagellar basal body P-ring formation chaperone FlgA [Undibacterium sp. CCC2.1]MEB0170735.1 flagellar basal body P-ring formation chaperone FlgA [Undibacterium sp. CCC1.1]MEB0174624.1 flagellar basal body P-ring formation chaperone FlgA [Undibacterium sp. CCC3.4]MEB0213821.1 flagellar basal body P-ring formation chaperone FlgA [Undibacterium sp. 5I2]WPX42548.1 flagellar basal body P-r